jgi:hypothetical protein
MKPSEQAEKWVVKRLHARKDRELFNIFQVASFEKGAWLAGVRHEQRRVANKCGSCAYKKLVKREIRLSDSRQEKSISSVIPKQNKRTPAYCQRRTGNIGNRVSNCPKNINSKSTLNKKLKEKEERK